MLRNLNIGLRLIISFFLIASLSAAIIGYISFKNGKDSLERESFNRLTAVREMKASQIEDYFELIHDQVITFADDPTITRAMMEFKAGTSLLETDLGITEDELKPMRSRVLDYHSTYYIPNLNKNSNVEFPTDAQLPLTNKALILQDLYIASNPKAVGSKHLLDFATDTSFYSRTHRKFHPYIREYLEKFGYYDIFLIDDRTGQIVYSVFKEVDYGTSLIDGPFKSSNLAKAFKDVVNSNQAQFVKLVDYEPYHPSYNAHAAFIATPVIKNGKRIGVLAFQMPIDKINNIMTNKENWESVGLGKSGETYIVGSDFTLRNQSRFLIEDSENYFKLIEDLGTDEETIAKIKNFNSTIGLQVVKTEGTKRALNGETDSRIFPDYRGVPVLSSFKPLKIADMNWVIMSEIDEEEAFAHVYELRRILLMVFGGIVMLIFVMSYVAAKRITKPLKHLTGGAKQLAKGNMEAVIHVRGKDEVGVLALSFKKMQVSIRNLIIELKDINQNLENKVQERTYELQEQKDMIQEKNREIVDSINYAKRLQSAILPKIEKIKEIVPESFVLFKPKDIVSGDFYWMDHQGDNLLIAAVDCTGHGVPGAMVSVVGANGLSRCVKEFGLQKPSEILDKLVNVVTGTFEAHDNDEVKDGMDIALCSIDTKRKTVNYSGAHNPLWIIRKGSDEVLEIKANKQPIGLFEYMKPFDNHQIQLEAGDSIYIFTDGYADQFGGPRGKKLKYKSMKNLLLSLQNESMEKQMSVLDDSLVEWQGDLEQVDDVCVIGIRL